ncbi:hypothetical protein ACQP3L_34405, partial [Escherichia coli]
SIADKYEMISQKLIVHITSVQSEICYKRSRYFLLCNSIATTAESTALEKTSPRCCFQLN